MAGVAAAATSVLGKPSKAQGKPTVREQEKKLVFKGYLQSALEPTWPVIQPEDAREIVSRLSAAALAMPDRHRLRSKRRRVDASAEAGAPEETTLPDAAIPRCDIAVGVNEVTRGLENGGIAVVIVARSPATDQLTRHLILLTHTKGAVLCALPDIGPMLARIAGAPRACVVGIRRAVSTEQQSACAETNTPTPVSTSTAALAQAISSRATPTQIPWLPAAGGLDGSATDGHSAPYHSMTVKKMGFPEKSKSSKKAKQKGK